MLANSIYNKSLPRNKGAVGIRKKGKSNGPFLARKGGSRLSFLGEIKIDA
jgi:hypothetical protein